MARRTLYNGTKVDYHVGFLIAKLACSMLVVSMELPAIGMSIFWQITNDV